AGLPRAVRREPGAPPALRAIPRPPGTRGRPRAVRAPAPRARTEARPLPVGVLHWLPFVLSAPAWPPVRGSLLRALVRKPVRPARGHTDRSAHRLSAGDVEPVVPEFASFRLLSMGARPTSARPPAADCVVAGRRRPRRPQGRAP